MYAPLKAYKCFIRVLLCCRGHMRRTYVLCVYDCELTFLMFQHNFSNAYFKQFNLQHLLIANHDLGHQVEVLHKHGKNHQSCRCVSAKYPSVGHQRLFAKQYLVEHILVQCQCYPQAQSVPIFLKYNRSIRLWVY